MSLVILTQNFVNILERTLSIALFVNVEKSSRCNWTNNVLKMITKFLGSGERVLFLVLTVLPQAIVQYAFITPGISCNKLHKNSKFTPIQPAVLA